MHDLGLVVPKHLQGGLSDKVREYASAGNVDPDYAAKCEKWFYLYAENKNATRSAILAGFDNSQPSWKGHQLVKKFRPLLMELTVVGNLASEPLAVQRVNEILQEDYHVPLVLKNADGGQYIARDDKGEMIRVADPKMAAVVLKAADSTLDRSILPKNIRLHGSGPSDGEGSDSKDDWTATLDMIVAKAGLEMAWTLPVVKGRVDMQEYLGRKYPKVVSIQAETVE